MFELIFLLCHFHDLGGFFLFFFPRVFFSFAVNWANNHCLFCSGLLCEKTNAVFVVFTFLKGNHVLTMCKITVNYQTFVGKVKSKKHIKVVTITNSLFFPLCSFIFPLKPSSKLWRPTKPSVRGVSYPTEELRVSRREAPEQREPAVPRPPNPAVTCRVRNLLSNFILAYLHLITYMKLLLLV